MTAENKAAWFDLSNKDMTSWHVSSALKGPWKILFTNYMYIGTIFESSLVRRQVCSKKPIIKI